MTTINTDITQSGASVAVNDRFARFKTWLAEAFERYARLRSRRDQIEALEALSDEDLARIGLTRNTIVMHVFGDRFYM